MEAPTLKQELEKRTVVPPPDLWANERGDGVRCVACGHRCFIPNGRDGICKVRGNRGGKLHVPWGYVGGIQVDPIEKKPFFHVRPGSMALSFGMLGCDLHCGYCQNWLTSQALRDPSVRPPASDVSAGDLAKLAKRAGALTITSTYNEPLITSEWAVEVFREAKRQRLATSFVSNGNATPEVLRFLRPHVDYYKIDLKGFRDKPYRELGGVLANVLRSIEDVYRLGFWLEIVTLVVPGFNDSDGEMRDLCRFLRGISPDIPWHATAFHPDYKMRDRDATQAERLLAIGEIAKAEGLRYVYLGNLPGRLGKWENTYCGHCGVELVTRRGFRVLRNRMTSGECPDCRKPVPGVWVGRAEGREADND